MNNAVDTAVALAAAHGYHIDMPSYRKSFVLPFRNRKRFKQTPMPSRSYFPDIEDLKVGDVVRFRFNTDNQLSAHASQRFLGIVTETALTDSDGMRGVRISCLGSSTGAFQNEVLEVIKNPRTQA